LGCSLCRGYNGCWLGGFGWGFNYDWSLRLYCTRGDSWCTLLRHCIMLFRLRDD
jgi:hypothetical protein